MYKVLMTREEKKIKEYYFVFESFKKKFSFSFMTSKRYNTKYLGTETKRTSSTLIWKILSQNIQGYKDRTMEVYNQQPSLQLCTIFCLW